MYVYLVLFAHNTHAMVKFTGKNLQYIVYYRLTAMYTWLAYYFDLTQAYIFLPFMIIAPLHMIVFTYLEYQEVDWVVFVTLFFFVLQIPVQLVLAKIFTKFR